MPYYDFCLIGGDGVRLRRERHLAPDFKTVWGFVFRMAESQRGRAGSVSWTIKAESSSA